MQDDDQPDDAALLELDGITVRRGSTRILDRLSTTIRQRRHCAILGPNGSGKTSLLKVLTREFYPSVESDGAPGSVRILGHERWEVAALRRQMGVVSSSLDQTFSSGRSGAMSAAEAVASGFTATQLAAFGPSLEDEQVRRATEQALRRVDALPLSERTVATLSTGERRRVLIARALVHQPRILVLDEPTTGLDIAARHRFLGWLRGLVQDSQLTLVLVTHHVEEVLPEIDHVVLLDRGRVAFDGTKAEALTGDRLSRLYGVPLDVQRHADSYVTVFLRTDSPPRE